MFMRLEQDRAVDGGKDGIVPQQNGLGITLWQGDGCAFILLVPGGIQRLHAGVLRAFRQFLHGPFTGRLGRALVRRRGQEHENVSVPVDGGGLAQFRKGPRAVYGLSVDLEPLAHAAHGGGHFFRNGAVRHRVYVQQEVASLGDAFHQFFNDGFRGLDVGVIPVVAPLVAHRHAGLPVHAGIAAPGDEAFRGDVIPAAQVQRAGLVPV